jgi:hypothetical protein
MDDRSEGSLIEMDHAHHQKQNIINKPLQRTSFLLRCATTANWRDVGQVMIDILPGDVLLEIFDYYLAETYEDGEFEEWQMLVHVCQKWRHVVFQSPLRLNLRIFCSAGRPAREKLAVWPPLPIIIDQYGRSTSKWGEDNIIAALGHNDRVCKIDLTTSSSLVESVLAAMQKSFVALKYLWLNAMDDTAPVVSDSFLGVSASHLRSLRLTRIAFPFPVFRKLPLSAPNLVILSLRDIPHSAYFSPEAMVTCLSALTRLNHLCIGFKSPRSRPPREGRYPPPTRSILPALTELRFIGVSEYLEDLVTRIDAPLLAYLDITFFYQFIFDTPHLVQFISRTPNLKAYDGARLIFSETRATIALRRRDSMLALAISCTQSDWQLFSLAQVYTSSFPQALILKVENLYILEYVSSPPRWQDGIEINQWFELFHPFTTVKNLYLSQEFVPRIAPTLQELVGERVTEVLPNLHSIFLNDPQESMFVPEAKRQFIAARELSSRPIAISQWNKWPTIYDTDD